ncbi:MAG: hypothetical protein H3C41_10620 [Bacteroidales bacterium]|nr:hypothetical protein [Bacteroidales bacterium]
MFGYIIHRIFASKLAMAMLLKRLSVLALAFLVLLGSTGLPMNRHYCQSNQTESIRISPFVSACEHHAVACQTESAHKSHDCCQGTKNPDPKPVKNCCHDSISYHKGFTDSDLPKIQLKSLFSLLPAIIAFHTIFEPERSTDLVSWFPSPDPPPLRRRALSILFHQLKIGNLFA